MLRMLRSGPGTEPPCQLPPGQCPLV